MLHTPPRRHIVTLTFSSIHVLGPQRIRLTNGRQGLFHHWYQLVDGQGLGNQARLQLRREIVPKANLLFHGRHGEFFQLQLQLLVGSIKDRALEDRLQAGAHFDIGCQEPLDGLDQRWWCRGKQVTNQDTDRIRVHGVHATGGFDHIPTSFLAFGGTIGIRCQEAFVIFKVQGQSSTRRSNTGDETKVPQFDIAGWSDKERGW